MCRCVRRAGITDLALSEFMVHKSDVTYEVPLSSFSDFVGIQTEMIAETEEKATPPAVSRT